MDNNKQEFDINRILSMMFPGSEPIIKVRQGRFAIKTSYKYGVITKVVVDEFDITNRLDKGFQDGLETVLKKGRLFVPDFSGTVWVDIVKEENKISNLYVKIGHRVGINNTNKQS